MQEEDVWFADKRAARGFLVTATIFADDFHRAQRAAEHAEQNKPAGYRLSSITFQPRRPRGGKKWVLELRYAWNHDSPRQLILQTWEQWQAALVVVELIARVSPMGVGG